MELARVEACALLENAPLFSLGLSALPAAPAAQYASRTTVSRFSHRLTVAFEVETVPSTPHASLAIVYRLRTPIRAAKEAPPARRTASAYLASVSQPVLAVAPMVVIQGQTKFASMVSALQSRTHRLAVQPKRVMVANAQQGICAPEVNACPSPTLLAALLGDRIVKKAKSASQETVFPSLIPILAATGKDHAMKMSYALEDNVRRGCPTQGPTVQNLVTTTRSALLVPAQQFQTQHHAVRGTRLAQLALSVSRTYAHDSATPRTVIPTGFTADKERFALPKLASLHSHPRIAARLASCVLRLNSASRANASSSKTQRAAVLASRVEQDSSVFTEPASRLASRRTVARLDRHAPPQRDVKKGNALYCL